jgi:signal transduction histidine kinase
VVTSDERALAHRVLFYDREMAREALGNLLMAVTEAATNAIKHGTPPASVRLWTAAGYLVCEITDHGQWEPGALLGLIPPASTP